MEIFLVVIGVFFLGVCFGWYAHAKAMYAKIITDPDSMISLLQKLKDVNDEVDESTDKSVKVENHEGRVFLFDHDNTFLAQGTSVTDALDAAEKRFPNRKFYYRLNLPNESNQ
jgi:hypothetical protein